MSWAGQNPPTDAGAPRSVNKRKSTGMAKFKKGQSGNPRGRPPGAGNKVPGILKEAIVKAAEIAGGKDGLIGYLQTQAIANPSAFMALLGRVVPLQMTGDPDNPIHVSEVRRIIVRQ
jgi:hypothetical protein